MATKKGSLSISSENIFPIIKKWVYSDHDIFARELVSNGCDAITKLKKLDMMGEYTLPDDYKGKIQVIIQIIFFKHPDYGSQTKKGWPTDFHLQAILFCTILFQIFYSTMSPSFSITSIT